MSLEWMSVVGFLVQVSGVSAADILRRFDNKSEKRLISRSMIGLLSVFDDDNDPFTGLWELNRWKYEWEYHKGYHVMGRLAVLYRVPNSDLWRGTLFLKYCRSPSDKGWRARRRGDLIDGIYDIEIQKEGKSSYGGTSTQKYRDPKSELMNSGEFSNIRIDKEKLVCKFFNTNTRGQADVVFHQRKRWKELS